MKLSVVVCTHNRYEFLDNALKSIELQNVEPHDLELIVVDNSSDLESQKDYYPKIDLLCDHKLIFEQIPGLSRARNIGVRAAKHDIVAFIDDDAIASRAWASEILAAFRRHPKAGVVGGPVRPIWPVQRPAWLHPWLEGFLTIVDLGAEERELRGSEWLAGTNIAFRRQALLNGVSFNEQLGRIGKMLLSNEELAVTRRLHEQGYSAVYSPGAEVHHNVHKERIDQGWFRRRVFWQAISDMFDRDDQLGLEPRIEAALSFLDRMKPRDRNLVGLFKTLEDPDEFQAQTAAIDALVRLLATDARDWCEYLNGKSAQCP